MKAPVRHRSREERRALDGGYLYAVRRAAVPAKERSLRLLRQAQRMKRLNFEKEVASSREQLRWDPIMARLREAARRTRHTQ